MNREEWHNSKRFKILRLLNNMSHEITQQVQRANDVLQLIQSEWDILASDRFNLVERQLRIIGLEARNLCNVESNLSRMLSPAKYDDYPAKGMTWEEWAKTYPPKEVDEPPKNPVSEHAEYTDAVRAADALEVINQTACEVVQYEDKFYVIGQDS